jgi:hypothetical protein
LSTTLLRQSTAVTAAHLALLLDLRACWFEPFPFAAQLPRIEPGRIVLPAAEPGAEPWTVDRGVELPVRYDALTLGRFVLLPRGPTTGIAFAPSARATAIEIARDFAAPYARDLISGP